VIKSRSTTSWSLRWKKPSKISKRHAGKKLRWLLC